MLISSRRISSGALLLAGIFASVALAADGPMSSKGMDMKTAPARVGSPADQAYAKANAAMMADMVVKPSGDADRDFVAMMLPHHQGAVDMAKVELRYGHDPELRAMAASVVKAQEAEIGMMRAWQTAHPR